MVGPSPGKLSDIWYFLFLHNSATINIEKCIDNDNNITDNIRALIVVVLFNDLQNKRNNINNVLALKQQHTANTSEIINIANIGNISNISNSNIMKLPMRSA